MASESKAAQPRVTARVELRFVPDLDPRRRRRIAEILCDILDNAEQQGGTR